LDIDDLFGVQGVLEAVNLRRTQADEAIESNSPEAKEVAPRTGRRHPDRSVPSPSQRDRQLHERGDQPIIDEKNSGVLHGASAGSGILHLKREL
jgi:hypothetical protein